MKDENRTRKGVKGENIYFSLYALLIIAMAIIYFTVPKKSAFLEYQLEWWGEMLKIVIKI